MKYLLYIDETYRLDGQRTEQIFDSREEAISAYLSQRKGMVNITVIDDSGRRKVLQDENGKKYMKGSPFYNFPHIPHISILDGKEIPTT